MIEQELKSFMQAIKTVWRRAPESKEVEAEVSERFYELKTKTSQFEKNMIKKDLSTISTAIKRVFNPSKVK